MLQIPAGLEHEFSDLRNSLQLWEEATNRGPSEGISEEEHKAEIEVLREALDGFAMNLGVMAQVARAQLKEEQERGLQVFQQEVVQHLRVMSDCMGGMAASLARMEGTLVSLGGVVDKLSGSVVSMGVVVAKSVAEQRGKKRKAAEMEGAEDSESELDPEK